MITNLLDSCFLLPSTDDFLEAIRNDLLGRLCVVVAIPETLDVEEFEFRLYGRLRALHTGFQSVVLPDLNTEGVPVSALGERFDVKWQSSRALPTVENLLASNALPEYIFFERFHDLDSDGKERWFSFLERWHTAAVPSTDNYVQQKPGICIVVSDADLCERRMLHSPQLSLRRWLGFPSALEMQVLCRYGSAEQRQQVAVTRWKEHLIPSLAATDLHFASYLWEDILLPHAGLKERVKSYGIQKGWNVSSLNQWKAGDFIRNAAGLRNGSIPSLLKRYPHLWANGILTFSPEFGTELHTAALVLLDDLKSLDHRIWRGQLELILPLIDRVRLAICDNLQRIYGQDLSEEEAELGKLEYLLRTPQYRKESSWLTAIIQARKIRNDLAHYTPVSLQDYLSLIKESGNAKVPMV